MKMIEALPGEGLVIRFVEIRVDEVGEDHRDIPAAQKRAENPVTVGCHSCNSAITVAIPLSPIA